MVYETPTLTEVGSGSELIQEFAGPNIDGGFRGQSHLAIRSKLDEE
jgi:hypothetical protein